MGKKIFNNEDYQYMIDHYYDMTSSAIAKKIKCSRQLVLKIWRENGLSGKDRSRQYYFNFSYFNQIDTSNKAYIIGLLASDGNLYKRDNHQGQIQILLHKKDEKLLKDIIKEMDGNKPLCYFKDYATLTINSDEMYDDLLKIGLYDNKTYSINMNNINIPEEYKFDFLRGYFDGDGSIFKHLQTTCKNITPCCYYICISGYVHNLLAMKEFLLNKGISCQITVDKRKKYHGSEFGNLRFGSIKDKMLFITNIYKNDGIKLERKYNLAMEYLNLLKS